MAVSLSMGSDVCTLMFFSGFGEKKAIGYNKADGYNDSGVVVPDPAAFVKQAGKAIEYYNSNSLPSNQFHKAALVYCVTTSTQPVAEEALKNFGFDYAVNSGRIEKYNHEVTMWAMSMSRFIEVFNGHIDKLKVGSKLKVPEV